MDQDKKKKQKVELYVEIEPSDKAKKYSLKQSNFSDSSTRSDNKTMLSDSDKIYYEEYSENGRDSTNDHDFSKYFNNDLDIENSSGENNNSYDKARNSKSLTIEISNDKKRSTYNRDDNNYSAHPGKTEFDSNYANEGSFGVDLNNDHINDYEKDKLSETKDLSGVKDNDAENDKINKLRNFHMLDYEDGEDDGSGPKEENHDDSDSNDITKSKKPKKKKKKSTFILILIILAVSALLSYLIITGMNDVYAFSKPNTEAVIEIPMGTSNSEITELLHENGIINHKWAFRLVLSLRDDTGEFQAGTHYFKATWDYESIISELKTLPGESEFSAKLTFQEGITIDEIAAMLEKNEVCPADDFIQAVNNPTREYGFTKYLSGENDLKYYLMEGYVFPDTYIFYKNEDTETVVSKILSTFDTRMSEAGLYSKIESSDYTLDEVITLASIIQAEAGTEEDMLLISSVLHNRLNDSETYPKLECDPTRKYAENIPDNDAIATAYNTYSSEGLPPGAICNPGIDAISAVLNPAESEYYYFCANLDTKKCYYAKTLEEHNENLVKAGLA